MFDYPFPLPYDGVGACITEGTFGWDVLVFRDVSCLLLHSSGMPLIPFIEYVVAYSSPSLVEAVSWLTSENANLFWSRHWGSSE